MLHFFALPLVCEFGICAYYPYLFWLTLCLSLLVCELISVLITPIQFGLYYVYFCLAFS